jgi:hypothetical protein
MWLVRNDIWVRLCRGGEGGRLVYEGAAMTALTTAQVLAMEAGNEMNAAVATRVMECKRIPHLSGWMPPGGTTLNDMLPYNFDPSHDIAAAMEVVEKLNSRMWTMTLLPGEAIWQVRFIDDVPMLDNESTSLPLAICRAALLTTIPKETI